MLRYFMLLCFICLPGCFDYEARLSLNQDGSGEVQFSLNLTGNLENLKISWDEPLVARIYAPQPMREHLQEGDNRLLMRESAVFKALGELELSKLSWSLAMEDGGLLGLTAYTYKVTTTINGVEALPPPSSNPPGFGREAAADMKFRQPGQADAAALRAQAVRGHGITIVQTLPGRVIRGDSIDLGSYVVTPQIDNNTISWFLPLDMLIFFNMRTDLQFSCSFRGEYSPPRRYYSAWRTVPYNKHPLHPWSR
jgi:hypothetical protein